MNDNIIVMCAMQEEMDSIIGVLGVEPRIVTLQGFTYIQSTFNNKQLVFSLCGVGKVSSAIHTQHAICNFNPGAVINVGVAGGLSKELDFGDVVIATELVYHDFDLTAFGLPRGQISSKGGFAFTCHSKLVEIAQAMTHPDYKISCGRIVTGDQFIDDAAQAVQMHNDFAALACDMESAAIAHTCDVNKIPFLVVRALSDMAGQKDKQALHSFNELKDTVANRSANIVKYILSKI